jgi:hypothetical protein
MRRWSFFSREVHPLEGREHPLHRRALAGASCEIDRELIERRIWPRSKELPEERFAFGIDLRTLTATVLTWLH